jgi:transposase InsO family protein
MRAPPWDAVSHENCNPSASEKAVVDLAKDPRAGNHKSMISAADACQAVTQYFHHYNTVRLHSAIDYVTPHTKLAGNLRLTPIRQKSSSR